MENWMRTYTLEFGHEGSAGVVIGNTGSITDPVLHISFDAEKSDSEASNTTKIEVWNLSPEHLALLDEKDVACILKAGYGGNNNLIACGEITSVNTTVDNADRKTEIEVVDGRVALRDTNVSISKNGKVSAQSIYGMIAGEMGVSVVYGPGLDFANFPNGFSFVGNAATGLAKMASACGHSWSIQNG